MLYTTIPLARAQTSSQVFQDHDITNAAPASTSDLRISIVTLGFDDIISWFTQLLWLIIGIWYTEKPAKINQTINIMGNRSSCGIFTVPSLVVSFMNKVNEATEAKLTEMGFIIQTKGTYRYYKGPASESACSTLVGLGAQADAYAEYGCVNINGYMAFLAIDSVINGVLAFMKDVTGMAKKVWNEKKGSTVGYDSAWDGVNLITSAGDLPNEGKGILFPYFNGLVLPDKALPAKIVIDRFHRAFGNTPTEILRNTAILQEGWVSLSTSTAGCGISHLLFGISLALEAGVSIQAVHLNGGYSGFLLFAPNGSFAVHHGRTIVKPVEMSVIADELGMLNKHDTALAEIANLLSSIELRSPISTSVKDADGKETTVEVKIRDVSTSMLSTPRKLYNAFCLRKLSGQDIKALQAQVLKLEYKQTYWSVSDQGKVATAVALLTSRTSPTEDAPMAYKTSSLYNPDIVSSVLSAFGPVAFTLIGNNTGNGLIRLTTDGKFYEKTSGFTLQGAPVFPVALQKAVEEWTDLFKTGMIRLKHNGNDKAGRAKISGKYTMVPKGSKPYGVIVNGLVKIARELENGTKKRKAEDDTPQKDPAVEEERQSKRSKRDWGALGMIADPEQPMVVDTPLEF